MADTDRPVGERDHVTERALLTREESIERVRSMLGGAITPWIFLLSDGQFEGHLVVDPDIAWEVLRDGA